MIRMSIAWCMLDVRLSLENERRLIEKVANALQCLNKSTQIIGRR